MKICLVQFNPSFPQAGMLDSYNEVVETYFWGFKALGFDVSRNINMLDPQALNIVFGPQIASQVLALSEFPPNTILVNFERFEREKLSAESFEFYVAQRFQIWDYSQANVNCLNKLKPLFPSLFTRISYAPCLEKIPTGVEQDIDVLYYGKTPTLDRADTLAEVSKRLNGLTGLSVVTLCNIWGKQRDEFIARSKVIVNISWGNIFEIVRVSYLLANKKAVVCTISEELEIDEDLRDSPLKFVEPSDIYEVCKELVEDDDARQQYANECYQHFRRRDIRDVIEQALLPANREMPLVSYPEKSG